MDTFTPRPFHDALQEVIDFRAESNGSEYEIRVGLPSGYHAGDAGYPVLVALDAEYLFGMAHAMTLLEGMWAMTPRPGAVAPPEFIVVGIAFPDRDANPFRRNFEFMPEGDPDEYAPETRAYIEAATAMLGRDVAFGGAAAFLDVLTEEVLPLIAQRYRVDESRRMLFCFSAGATFGTFTLFTRPSAFSDYVLASPGMIDRSLFRLEAEWAEAHDDLPARVLISAGQAELSDPLQIVSNASRLIELLNTRGYPQLQLDSWLVPDATHAQAPAPSLSRALRSISTARA